MGVVPGQPVRVPRLPVSFWADRAWNRIGDGGQGVTSVAGQKTVSGELAKAPAAQDRGRGFLSGRSVAFWTVIGSVATVLSLLATVMPAQLIPRGTATPAQQSDATAEMIRGCEVTHRLNGAAEQQHPAAGITVYATCSWPPGPAADPDGYTSISVQEVGGPGADEASGSSEVDRIIGPCARYQLTYSFGYMGESKHLSAFGVSPNTVTTIDHPGVPWDGQLSPAIFYPQRGEVDVVRNGNYTLDQVACVAGSDPPA
jgi:hypothetical protein